MTMRLTFSALRGQFRGAIKEIERPIARAATGAIAEAGLAAKTEGRANIGSAGFGKKWQNALRDKYYPKGRESMRPAVQLYHRIPYADVFETGATIQGKPLLWVPITNNIPAKLSGRRISPSSYTRLVGPLASVNIPGRKPMLVAKADRGKKGTRKVSLASLRRGARGEGNVKSVPVFVGVDAVKLRKRFDLRVVFARVASRLGQLYLKHLRVD